MNNAIQTLGMTTSAPRAAVMPDEKSSETHRLLNQYLGSAMKNLEEYAKSKETWRIAAARGNWHLCLSYEADYRGCAVDLARLETTPLLASKGRGESAVKSLRLYAENKTGKYIDQMLEDLPAFGKWVMPMDAALFWGNVKDVAEHALGQYHRHGHLPGSWPDSLEKHWGTNEIVAHVEKLLGTNEK